MPRPREVGVLSRLQNRIGYRFQQPELLTRAVTHRSRSADHMERLEFLGDAVLGLVMAQYLHDRFTALAEGELSRMRAALVCKESLSHIARDWQLSDALQVGEGERTADGIRSPSIAANAVEAVVGAVFEDGGWPAARDLVIRAWQDALENLSTEELRDAKTRLQELTQARGWGLPDYRVTDLGTGSSPRFEAVCLVRGERRGTGRGARKKLAELAAAEQAWTNLNT